MERTRHFAYVYRDLDGKAQYVGYRRSVLRATSQQSVSHNLSPRSLDAGSSALKRAVPLELRQGFLENV